MAERPSLAEFLKRIIDEEKRIGVREIARELQRRGYPDMSPSTISRWKSGKEPSLTNLGALRQLPSILQLTYEERIIFEAILADLTGGYIPSRTIVARSPQVRFLHGKLKPEDFIQGEDRLRELRTIISNRQSLLITGLAGVGKTTLARSIVERTATQFKHGCNGLQLSPRHTLVEVVWLVGRQLEAPFSMGPINPNVAIALEELSNWAYGLDILFLLDNVGEGSQIERLITGLPFFTWIITSRRKLLFPTFPLHHFNLTPPPLKTAAQIVCRHAKVMVSENNLELAQQASQRLGCLPIGLRTAAGLVEAKYVLGLAGLVDWLEKLGLRVFQMGEWDIIPYLDGLLEMLQPVPARTLFELLGIFVTGNISYAAAKSIAIQLELDEALFGQLVALSLIEQTQMKVNLHPLIHEYATHRLARSEHQSNVVREFTRYYADYGRQHRGDRAALALEWENIWKAGEYARAKRTWEAVEPFWGPITGQLWIRQEWSKHREINEECLALVREAGDRETEATILYEIGWIYMEEEEWQTAETLFFQAKNIFDELGIIRLRARACRYLGILYQKQFQLDLSMQFFQESENIIAPLLPIVHESEMWLHAHLALVRHAQVKDAQLRGNNQQALALSEQAVQLARRCGLERYVAMTQMRRADILYIMHGLLDAVPIWHDVAAHGEKHEYELSLIAEAKSRMAQVEASQGNYGVASVWAHEARYMYAQSGLHKMVDRVNNLIAKIDSNSTDWETFELWD